jgi:hypothetical protein
MKMNLKLKKFDMAKLGFTKKRNNNSTLGSKVLILGKRATGKTYLVQDILQHYQDVPKVTVFVDGTDNADAKKYKKIMSESRIFRYSIQSVIDEPRGNTVSHDSDGNIDTRRIVVADSCVYDRHHILTLPDTYVMYILAEQHPLATPPMDREKFDYVFILKENVINNLKRIHNNYAAIFPSFEAFCAVMDQCTDNYGCLVLNNKACFGDKIEDVVFWYKAAPQPQDALENEDKNNDD